MNQQCEVDLTYSTRGIEEKNNLLYTEIIDNILVGQYQDGGGWNGMGRGGGGCWGEGGGVWVAENLRSRLWRERGLLWSVISGKKKESANYWYVKCHSFTTLSVSQYKRGRTILQIRFEKITPLKGQTHELENSIWWFNCVNFRLILKRDNEKKKNYFLVKSIYIYYVFKYNFKISLVQS